MPISISNINKYSRSMRLSHRQQGSKPQIYKEIKQSVVLFVAWFSQETGQCISQPGL